MQNFPTKIPKLINSAGKIDILAEIFAILILLCNMSF